MKFAIVVLNHLGVLHIQKETTDMLCYGLWQNVQQIESELEKIKSKTKQIDALKVQIRRLRKIVFQQKCDT